MNDEIPLTGGNVSTGVVRIGDTVRKPATAHSTAVAALLRHLTAQGVRGVPDHLGTDDQGRQILQFLPGTCGPSPDLWTTTGSLVQAARLLRRIHDASALLVDQFPGGWARSDPDISSHEVICHNDFAPYNMVFENGALTGVIDFDLAGPGPRLRDLAYLAYWMAPLSFGSGDMGGHGHRQLNQGSPRLHLLCQSYGTIACPRLLDTVAAVLEHMGSRKAAAEMVGAAAAQRLSKAGHLDHWQAEAAAFAAHLPALRASLPVTSGSNGG